MTRPRPVVLCILDGFGERGPAPDNAIALARKPTFDRLFSRAPHAHLATSGAAVGLPDGQMGNSEVGHMNIGAGRIATTDLPRIDKAIADGELRHNPVLGEFFRKVKEAGGRIHLMGLVSPGGVHSHQEHIAALSRIAEAAGLEVLIHAFLDGRDTPPQSAIAFVEKLQAAAGPRIATLTGRYFAMDRDRRWDRVARAYECLVSAIGVRRPDPKSAIEAAYRAGQTDEFVEPTVIGNYAGMRDGDGLLMANFRADRVREILLSLLDPQFDGFARARIPHFSAAAGMTEYSEALNALMATIMPPATYVDTLGEVVAHAHLRQLRLAETEKYAHVTFFLNGGREDVFPGEERILVPSPRVATYDLQPEMSAGEVTDRLIEAIESGRFDLIVVNYANGDMVGHTGRLDAAIKAVEALDRQIGRVIEALNKAGGVCLITADHGNVEMMRDPDTGGPHTAHTTFDVPIILYPAPEGSRLENGRLADVAPTVLDLLGLPQPSAMTGHSLMRVEPVRASA